MKAYHTVQEVASLLGVHPLTIRRYIKSGKLQAIRIGRNVRISVSALQVFNGREVSKDWRKILDEMVQSPKIFTLRDPLFQLEGIAQKQRPFLSHLLLLLAAVLKRSKERT